MTSPTVTARDFYGALTNIWLFLVMVAIQGTSAAEGWTAYVLPIGGLIMLGIHAREWRRYNAPKASH